MKKFTRYISMIIGVGILVSMPINHNVEASYSYPMKIDVAYPMPLSKPMIVQTDREKSHESNINKKQIMAAAIGIYLGLKKEVIQ